MKRTLVLAVTLALTACGDSTVLTGPQAAAAVAEAQARLESSGELQVQGLGDPDRPPPVIFVDGSLVGEDSRTVLQRLTPGEIERIEVIKGCRTNTRTGQAYTSGLIRIFTKSFDGEVPELESFVERGGECADLVPPGGGLEWLREAQQRHARD